MSFKASMAGFLARLCKADRKMAENLQNPPRNTGALDMERFTKKVRVKNWDIRGFKGVTVNGSYPGRGHILMLPGGAYSLEPGKHHRRIAERFAILDHMKVSVFQYPLSPEYTAVDVRIILMEAYERVSGRYVFPVWGLLRRWAGPCIFAGTARQGRLSHAGQDGDGVSLAGYQPDKSEDQDCQKDGTYSSGRSAD